MSAAAGGGADDYGALYGGGGKQLGNQIAGVLAIIAWVGFTSSVLFGVLKYAGMLRVPVEEEEVGLEGKICMPSNLELPQGSVCYLLPLWRATSLPRKNAKET